MSDTTTEPSLRDALEESFEPSTENAAPASAPASEPAPSPAPDAGPAGETDVERAEREYTRDQTGKFAPKATEETPKAAEQLPKDGITPAAKVGQPPAAAAAPSAVPALERAPQSWKPEAREFWKDIPAGARAEIMRHEQQVQGVLRETAEARRFTQEMGRVIEPYRATIEAEGSNPVAAVQNLLQTAQALRTAPPAHKAQLVAGLVQQFGIDINQLDQALSGVVQPPEPPEVVQMRQQMERELAPVRQFAQQLTYQQQQQVAANNARAAAELQSFAGQAEFIGDVRLMMADIMDAADARGQPLTLQQAYDISCNTHPEISKVMEQRRTATAAQNLNANAQKARQAAVSVSGSMAPGGPAPEPDSVRAALEAAMGGGA